MASVSVEAEKNATLKMLEEFASRDLATVIQESVTSISISITAVIGNILVLIAARRNPQLRKTQYLYIIALAAGDASMNLSGASVGYSLITGKPAFTHGTCIAETVLAYTSAVSSLYIIALISVKRYCKLLKRTLHARLFTRRNVKISIGGAWFIIISLQIMINLTTDIDFHPGFAVCTGVYFKMSATTQAIMMIIAAFIPLSVCYCCYIKIWLFIRRHEHSMAQSEIGREDIKASRILFFIVASFSFCLAPFVAATLIEVGWGRATIPRRLYLVCTNFYGMSSVVNPIIYGVMNKQFRREFKRIALCPCEFNQISPM